MTISIVYSEKEIGVMLPVTASESYLKAISNYKYGWFLSDLFVLPFIIDKKLFFKKMVFTYETIKILSVSENKKNSYERDFLYEVVRLCKTLKIDFIGQPKSGVVFQTYPEKSIHAPFGSYQVDLTKTEDELFAGLHVKNRNVIRKAIKEGVIIKEGSEYLNVCADLIKLTMVRQGIKFYVNLEDLQRMQAHLRDEIKFYIAYKDDIAQGCAVIVYRKGDAAYYLHGGSIEHPFNGSVNLIQWQAIVDMKNCGVLIYDFVGARISPVAGSKQETIQRFKSRFGSQMVEGYLWKCPIRPFRYKLYYLFVRLLAYLRKQPYKGDIIDQELS